MVKIKDGGAIAQQLRTTEEHLTKRKIWDQNETRGYRTKHLTACGTVRKKLRGPRTTRFDLSCGNHRKIRATTGRVVKIRRQMWRFVQLTVATMRAPTK
jgi:hypothetical protein